METQIMEVEASSMDPLERWWRLYVKAFGLHPNFSELELPARRPGFDRLIIVAEDLTTQRAYDVCAEHFPCWKYTDSSLDEEVSTNDRVTTKPYAIWVRDRVEADEELKRLSANSLTQQKIPGQTLLERLLHELGYWLETREHLDIKNFTLCAGSRGSDGDVPDAHWDKGFSVNWSRGDYSHSRLRGRQVISS